MDNQNTFWPTLTNILLGAFVILGFLIVLLGTLCEIVSKLKNRSSLSAELNHDMREMFAGASPIAALPRSGGIGSAQKLFHVACRTWRWITGRR